MKVRVLVKVSELGGVVHQVSEAIQNLNHGEMAYSASEFESDGVVKDLKAKLHLAIFEVSQIREQASVDPLKKHKLL